MNRLAESEPLKRLDNIIQSVTLNEKRFYTREVNWCCRISDENGHQLKPGGAEPIRNTKAPVRVGELCQFVH